MCGVVALAVMFEPRAEWPAYVVLSQVFNEHSEGLNFRRSMASLLGLPENASCARQVQVVMDMLNGSGADDINATFIAQQ